MKFLVLHLIVSEEDEKKFLDLAKEYNIAHKQSFEVLDKPKPVRRKVLAFKR